MAKMATCDICNTSGELRSPHGSIPTTWFVLHRGDYSGEQHLCSVNCLETATNRLRDAQIADALNEMAVGEEK